MNIQPTRDIVLIKADQPKEQTKSGIIIKEDWKTLPPTGEIIAVGPDVKEFLPGCKVLFERYAAVIVEDDLRLCQASHILGVIDDERE